MEHYFTNNTSLKHNEIWIDYRILDKTFKFLSDNGVFSKQHVDFASDILLKNMPTLKGTLLDVGCGYGCLGIVLGKLNNISVTMIDINEKAVELSKKNSEINEVKTDTFVSDLFLQVTDSYDNIITNPPIRAGKEVIFKLYQNAINHLNINGKFYLIIQEKHGAKSTEKELKRIFGNCETIYKKKGFYIFCSEKTV